MRAWYGLALLICASGCQPDPCRGISGACVNALVEGSVTGLDQLRVLLEGVDAKSSPATPAAFTLPVRLAIVLPQALHNEAKITIEGLAGGAGVVASSGMRTVRFSAGAHVRYTFKLVGGASELDGSTGGDGAGGGDGGADDAGPDGSPPPGHVTVSPSHLAFAETPRGGASKPQTLTVYNRTGQSIHTVPNDMMGGPDDFEPIGVTPASCTVDDTGLTAPAGVDCQLQMVFKPRRGGVRDGQLVLTFSNGDQASLSFSGTATPVWSAEEVETGGQLSEVALNAVWADEHGAYVVGTKGTSSPTGVAYHAPIDQGWMADLSSPPLGRALRALFGIDSQSLWAGGDSIFARQNDHWATSTVVGMPGAVTGLWAASDSEAYAVTVLGYLYQLAPSGWQQLGVQLNGGEALNAIAGRASGDFVVAGAEGFLARSTSVPGMMAVQSSGVKVDLFGVWMAGGDDYFAVGASGTILRCTAAQSGCKTENSLVSAPLQAIAGRHNPATGKLDVWVAGALGNQLLYSNGDGSWKTVQVPNTQAMNGVFVLPSGEVYAVGYQGQINHLF